MSSTVTAPRSLGLLESDYTTASVTHLAKCIGIIEGFGYSHSVAAARAILYHWNFCNARHDFSGRLHPMYIPLCNLGSIDEARARKILLQETLSDVLDAVRENFHVSYRKLMELSDFDSGSHRRRDIILCSMSRLSYSIRFCCAGHLN